LPQPVNKPAVGVLVANDSVHQSSKHAFPRQAPNLGPSKRPRLHHDHNSVPHTRPRAIALPFLTRWRRPPPTVRVYSPRPVAAPRSCQPGTREVARCWCSHTGELPVAPSLLITCRRRAARVVGVFPFSQGGTGRRPLTDCGVVSLPRRPQRSCVRARAGGGPCCSVRARRRRRRRHAPSEATRGARWPPAPLLRSSSVDAKPFSLVNEGAHP
jgi:hypothetical protein